MRLDSEPEKETSQVAVLLAIAALMSVGNRRLQFRDGVSAVNADGC
jgi:hypothetical protein